MITSVIFYWELPNLIWLLISDVLLIEKADKVHFFNLLCLME